MSINTALHSISPQMLGSTRGPTIRLQTCTHLSKLDAEATKHEVTIEILKISASPRVLKGKSFKLPLLFMNTLKIGPCAALKTALARRPPQSNSAVGPVYWTSLSYSPPFRSHTLQYIAVLCPSPQPPMQSTPNPQCSQHLSRTCSAKRPPYG